jgi:hypothetical protein
LKSEAYFNLLNTRLNKHFKIEVDSEINNKKWDVLAVSNMVFGRHFISKQDIVDRYESNEYIMIKSYENLDEASIEDVMDYLKKLTETYIKPHKEHKSSYITVVLACDNTPNENIIKKIKSFRCSKIYKFYLHGFCEVKLVLVDLKDLTVITNKAAKSVKKVYNPTP